MGIDGDYVNRDLLRITKDCFEAWDLGKRITMDRKFDLVVFMEVAEHLLPSRSESLEMLE